MSVTALERTAALPNIPSSVFVEHWHSEQGRTPVFERSSSPLPESACLPILDHGTRAISAPVTGTMAGAGGLALWAFLSVLTQQETSAPWTPSTAVLVGKPREEAASPAQRLCNRLKAISNLTNEEIAPLVGVSRRSFQSWLAGSPISARKETRLRSIVDAVEKIAAPDPVGIRSRLLDQDAWSVRPYDLLVEERFAAAVNLGIGVRKALVAHRNDIAESLALQLDRDQASLGTGEVRLNRRLSRSLKR